MHQRFQPRVDFALVMTDLPEIAPSHRPRSRCYLATSGGKHRHCWPLRSSAHRRPALLRWWGAISSSLWAAAELGASKALVIDVLPQIPGLVAKTFVGAMKLLSPFRAIVPASMKVVRLAPPKLLGARSTPYTGSVPMSSNGSEPESATRRNKTFHSDLFWGRIEYMASYQIHRLKDSHRQQFRWRHTLPEQPS